VAVLGKDGGIDGVGVFLRVRRLVDAERLVTGASVE